MNEHILKSIAADLYELKQNTGKQPYDAESISDFLLKYPIRSNTESLLSLLHNGQPEYDLDTLASIVAEECDLL